MNTNGNVTPFVYYEYYDLDTRVFYGSIMIQQHIFILIFFARNAEITDYKIKAEDKNKLRISHKRYKYL